MSEQAQWYYARNGEKFGPLTSAQLKQAATDGRLLRDDLVWRQGFDDWRPANQARGLFPAEPAETSTAKASPAGPVNSATQAAASGYGKDSDGAIWNPNAAANWSLLLSPVFGSYLHALNWRTLGEKDRASSAMAWFYISLVMLVLNVFVGKLALLYLIIWYFAAGKPQADYVKEKFGSNYLRKSWGKPLLIGFAAIIGYWAVLVSVVFTLAALSA